MKRTRSGRIQTATSSWSRRALLKTLIGGAGAAVFAPELAAAPSRPKAKAVADDSTGRMWTDTLPVGPLSSGLYQNGMVWAIGTQSGSGSFTFTDIQSGGNADEVILNLPQTGALVSANGIVLAPMAPQGDYNTAMFVWDPDNSDYDSVPATFPTPVSNQVSRGNYIVYVTNAGNLVAITPVVDDDGTGDYTTVWTLPLNSGTINSAAIDFTGNSIFIGIDDRRVAMAVVANNTPTLYWCVDFPVGGVVNSVAQDGLRGYMVSDSAVQACNLLDGSKAWSAAYTSQAQLGPAISYNTKLYFGDSGGSLNVLDAATGTASGSPASLKEDVSASNLYIEDGVAYTSSSAGTVFAVDLTNNDIVTFAGTPGPAGALLGLENGVCFIVADGGGSITGVDMALQVHGFSCESTLQADSVVAASNADGYIPASPVYHTVVYLVDPNKNPRVNVNVKVWASDSLTISDGVNTYNIDPNTPAWLQTDSSGHLNITSTATDVSCPALYLWGSFMDRSESILIYPDQDVANNLAANSANIGTATNYNGDPIIINGVNPSDVQNVVTNTMGGGTSSVSQIIRRAGRQNARSRIQSHNCLASRRRKAASQCAGGLMDTETQSYFAFPDTTTNMAYLSQPGSSARPFNAQNANDFSYEFTSSGALVVAPPPATGSTALLGLSLKDFKDAIIHGERKIAKIACTVAKDINQAVHTVYDDLGNLYTITVTALEDAISVVAGFLKTVLTSIDNAIQWLSRLFNWKGILAMQDQIISQFNTNITAITSWCTLQASSNYSPVQGTFTALENTLASAFSDFVSAVGAGSMQSQQQGNNDPKTAYSYGGAKSYGPTSSMTAKVQNNASGAQPVSTALLGGSFDTLPTLVFALLKDVGEAIADTLPQIETDLAGFFDGFKELFVNPTAFIEHSVAEIFNLIGDLGKLLLDAIGKIIQTLLENLAQLLQALTDFLNHSYNIPVISDIWGLISGGKPLTVLNLATLVIAIPTYMVAEATNSLSAAARSVGSSLPLQQVMAGAFAGIFGAVVDAAVDAADIPANDLIAGVDITCSSVAWILSIPTDFATNNAGNYCLWVFALLPVFISLMSAACYGKGSLPNTDPNFDQGSSDFLSKTGPALTCCFGIFYLLISGLLAATYPSNFDGKNHISFLQNMFSSLDYIPKPLTNAGTPGRVAVAINDVASPLASWICGIIQSS
jgi:hypothetical protein